ncbi:MAG: hypothetical protein IK111_06545 [Lachnospiraceae bacterium]|nr:hypothetical protein [Lachnospiraceae bacterium]
MAGLSALDSAYLRSQTNNYSTLFSSLNNSGSKDSFNMFDVSGKSNNSLSTNFYSDYASLKNGSYFKLAKTYYDKQASEVKDASSANTTKAAEQEDTDYAKLASTISEAAKQFGGYSANGSAGTVDTAGSIFDTAS